MIMVVVVVTSESSVGGCCRLGLAHPQHRAHLAQQLLGA
jgi:hypothetical protein